MWADLAKNCVATSDQKLGGRYAVYTDSHATNDGWPTDRVGRLGVYVEIVPEQRRVYALHWDAPVGYNQKGEMVPDEVFVVTHSSDGDETSAETTLLEIHHLGIPDDGVSAAGHKLGLGAELEMLAALVESA
ncbi:MAG: hypothetical protein GY722_13945 [bacterium]|nr:hypothetical protein [bacterium]